MSQAQTFSKQEESPKLEPREHHCCLCRWLQFSWPAHQPMVLDAGARTAAAGMASTLQGACFPQSLDSKSGQMYMIQRTQVHIHAQASREAEYLAFLLSIVKGRLSFLT